MKTRKKRKARTDKTGGRPGRKRRAEDERVARINVTFKRDLLADIDAACGTEPRAQWLARAARAQLAWHVPSGLHAAMEDALDAAGAAAQKVLGCQVRVTGIRITPVPSPIERLA